MRMRGYRPATWETDKVLWRNAQWAVTTYGIENVAGPYHYCIEKRRIPERFLSHSGPIGWVEHMSQKTWVDADAFAEVFAQARQIHGEAKRE
jgi:hypothetical protein